MRNDFTEIRFESDDNAVGVNEFQFLCDTLLVAAQAVTQTMVGANVQIRLKIVASPQQGSVIISIAPQFIFNTNIADLSIHANREIAETLVAKFAGLAAIGAFAWQVLFGGRGIFDLFRQKKIPVGPARPIFDGDLRQWLTNEMLINSSFLSALQNVVNAAAGSGTRRVTITVDGEEPVTIWDQTLRTEPGLLFPIRPRITNPPNFVQRVGDIELTGKFRGRDTRIICVDGFDQQSGVNPVRLIAVWMSRHPTPKQNQLPPTFVRAEIIREPKDLEIDDAVPQQFEGASGVILVLQSGAMG